MICQGASSVKYFCHYHSKGIIASPVHIHFVLSALDAIFERELLREVFDIESGKGWQRDMSYRWSCCQLKHVLK